MRAHRASGLLIAPALALLLGGCDGSQSKAERPPPPPPTVTVAQPLKRMVPVEEEQVGRFVAVDRVDVRARVSGYLEAIHFRDGQMVKTGDRLFSIDRRPFEIALEQARANLRQAESALELAENELARAKSLVMGSTITPQTMDQRAAARRTAEAAVEARKADVSQAMLDLEFTDLTAPISGRIGDSRVSPGNLVTAATSPNSSVLANIQSIDPIRIEFTLDESAYLRLKRSDATRQTSGDGLRVRLRLIDETEFVHEGRMDFLDNAMSRTSGTIRARAEIANPNGLFAPGMFARVRIAVAEPAEALLIPDAAVGSEQVRKLVMVVDDDNVARSRYVTLGRAVDGLRVIENGLAAGDRVIIDGLMRARPGTRVAPKPGSIAAAPPLGAAPRAN